MTARTTKGDEDDGDGETDGDDENDEGDEALEKYTMNLWGEDEHNALVKLATGEIRATTVKKIQKSDNPYKGFEGLSKRAFAQKLDKQVEIQCDKRCRKVLNDSLRGWWGALSKKGCYRMKAP